MLTLTRKQLTDRGACGTGLDWFDSRADENGSLSYPNGFDAAEIQRLGTAQPKFLKWLAKNGLIPGMTLKQARVAVHAILGTDPGTGPQDNWRLD
jgi:hypothetical protein